MILRLSFGVLGSFDVEMTGVTVEARDAVHGILERRINSREKSREVLAEVFLVALERCPEANPSDLWHHLIYRDYLGLKVGTNPSQSWVRTSGEAFEIVLSETYHEALAPNGIRLRPLFSKIEKRDVLERMGIQDAVGSEKIDLVVEARGAGAGVRNGYGVIGAIHAKASLAERVSDDIPASRIMMDAGFLSVLCTLDVKSFPPPHGDLVNRGELGSPNSPTDKRDYIETHGDFSLCVSYNQRTTPSGVTTPSGRKILVTGLGAQIAADDPFVGFLTDAL